MPSPVQDANSPKARPPTVARSVTRRPLVPTWAQLVRCRSRVELRPERPSVCHVQEPDLAHPAAPSGRAPAARARRSRSSRRRRCVLPKCSTGSRNRRASRWPMTQPVPAPMKVAEVGRKLAGTGAGAGRRPPSALRRGAGRLSGAAADECAAPAAVARVQHGQVDHLRDGDRGGHYHRRRARGDRRRRNLRRRARRLIRSKVPGGGGSGSIRPSSQESRSSRRSAITVPQRGAQLSARREQVGLDRARAGSIAATSLSGSRRSSAAGKGRAAGPAATAIRLRTSASSTG